MKSSKVFKRMLSFIWRKNRSAVVSKISFDVDHFFRSLYKSLQVFAIFLQVFLEVLNLLQYCFCFMFFLAEGHWPEAGGILAPRPGMEGEVYTPCTGRWSLNHWTTREIRRKALVSQSILVRLLQRNRTNRGYIERETWREKYLLQGIGLHNEGRWEVPKSAKL